ncbi:EamA family transporter [Cohnella sp. GCM10012308]|uniref:EamA family transporter n=1 Tax=Cohnella sp. GCM10012308 TaxID=3317329 RepID=UPI00361D856B
MRRRFQELAAFFDAVRNAEACHETVVARTSGEPILAIILAHLLLGEDITLFQSIGGLLTLFGMAMYFWSKSRDARRLALQAN